MTFNIALRLALILTCGTLMAGENVSGRGLVQLSDEHLQHMDKRWPKILKVKPNTVGVNRLKQHLADHGKTDIDLTPAYSVEDEIITNKIRKHVPMIRSDVASSLGSAKVSTLPLPSSVDNSELPSFPPIGNQGQQGSCVAWGSTYYQTTHEIGLLNGYNNKTSFQNVLSPKWTYNLLNNGVDQGLNILSAYQLLMQNGAATLVEFPYDGNYLSWDLNASDWIAALANRTLPAHIVTGVNSMPQNLTAIKQLLSNGHVLTFGTFIDSWVFTTIKKNSSLKNNSHVGELAASWLNGSEGGHCMTIVGYDDNIWIDVNANGKVDAGEMGAFLIANSWGTDWGNNGFVWIAYDAFLPKSAVVNGPEKGRVGAADAMAGHLVSVLPKAANYKPSLVAQFSLSQTNRNQLAITAGVSPTTQTSPLQTLLDVALDNSGGSYCFNGNSSSIAEEATFALDLTDLLPTNNLSETQRYYLLVTDSASGAPTTLNSFSLINITQNTQVANTNTPLVCDKSTAAEYIDYAF